MTIWSKQWPRLFTTNWKTVPFLVVSLPPCKGVVAFGKTLRECESELRSTLEDWILVGLKLGHKLPILSGIDLNRVPLREQMDTV